MKEEKRHPGQRFPFGDLRIEDVFECNGVFYRKSDFAHVYHGEQLNSPGVRATFSPGLVVTFVGHAPCQVQPQRPPTYRERFGEYPISNNLVRIAGFVAALNASQCGMGPKELAEELNIIAIEVAGRDAARCAP